MKGGAPAPEPLALGVLEVREGPDARDLHPLDDLLAAGGDHGALGVLDRRHLDRAHERVDRPAVLWLVRALALEARAVDAGAVVASGGQQPVVDRAAVALRGPAEHARVEGLGAI